MTSKEMRYTAVILKKLKVETENLSKEINQLISDQIGPIAKLDKIQFVSGLPKTRSGKIKCKVRKIAEGDYSNFEIHPLC
jgi:acetyl-CoA synthetase